MRFVPRSAWTLLPLLLIACREQPSAPVQQRVPIAGPPGLMEITITGIGTPQQKASVRSVSAGQAATVAGDVAQGVFSRGARIILDGRLSTLPDTSATVNGTVQMSPVSTASFTWGTRTGGGYRYVSATYQVRNASDSGVAYGDARTNLTFLAVNTPSTLSGTAISVLRRFDNSSAAAGLATSVLPTGWADLSSTATLTSRAPDVLQVYTEAEAGALTVPADVTSILPYGFVVSNPSTSSSRTLAANPGTSQYDGLVTFAFKVPLQSSATDDPFTITAVFLPVDDDQVVVTQSFEEADVTSTDAIAARATSLGGRVRSLVGTGVASSPATLVCTVRTAGSSGSPTAFIGDSVGITSESPSPYVGAASFLSANASLSATFSQNMASASATSFVVNSSQGGRAFLAGTYNGGNTTTLSTSSGSFRPGEELEVALTAALLGTTSGARVCNPLVYRYRVATASATAEYAAGSPITVGGGPFKAAVGDVDHDGNLDIVTANFDDNTVTVLRGDGSGGFSAAPGSPRSVGGTNPFGLALSDVNGDGNLDIIVSNEGSNNISVLLGDGTGKFTPAPRSPFSVGAAPYELAVGDINGDGKLDIVSASSSGQTITVLFGDGTGNFVASPGSPIAAGAGFGVALGDVNRDGKLDIIVPNSSSNTVTVLLGDGQGGFSADPNGPFTVGNNPNSVAVADFDGDGKLDLAVGNESAGTVSILKGDGSGGFTLKSTVTVGGDNILYLAVGDVNGDGTLDIIAPRYSDGASDNTVVVLLGDGTGGFSAASGSPFTVGTNPGSVAVGDLNGDGKLDLVVSNKGDNTVTVLLNP